ncbi:MAG: GNAT family N-acetyltransferase [Gammaproteobacteria bacterium]|nr:GNAT family N-acetyltransferase [Gammaproteobacteria bacterium]
MQLREATIDDIPELCGLLNYLFEQEEEFKPNTEIQSEGLRKIISNSDVGVIIIAIDSNKVIGMVNILYTVSTALGSRVAILEDMVVSPKARGKGMGSMLMKYSLDVAKQNGCKRITLLTDFDNDGAHRFYQQHGFICSSMVAFRKSI